MWAAYVRVRRGCVSWGSVFRGGGWGRVPFLVCMHVSMGEHGNSIYLSGFGFNIRDGLFEV